ncbi:MAG: ral L-amino acid transport system permease protein [Alphaproteobacteria bacterium]|jgi:general L-amino acid transport system permease protein|nr:ral L-amino acid transport system permease protein [Alphaproteobacteria bacterium]
MRRRSGERVDGPPRVAFYNNPRIRSALYQLLLLAALAWLAYEFALNARANLAARGFSSGFGFLGNTAGFGVSQSLIPYSETDTYGRVFWVGLLNTLLVAGVGIVLATLLGFVVGIARLSSNWLVARLAGGYVELIRNLPLLFQILFWYLAIIGTMPGPRESISILGMFLNNRGIIAPRPIFSENAWIIAAALALAVLATLALRVWARRRQDATGAQFPVGWAGLALILGLPLVALIVLGFPVAFERPQLERFNIVGGIRLIPEFLALLIALTTYTAAFIAEIVRAGILAVSRGQTEAALALGFRRGQMLRLIIVPQAMRVIVPPLTNQYLNLTKNSSLAVAIGYPDLFALFAGTTLNQTHQAIEIIAITMAVYLSISLLTSLAMNWYNTRLRLIER